MTEPVTVYVSLPDEAVDVWRPVLAEHLDGNRYRLLEQQPYDAKHESWEFVPGDVVICEYITLNKGFVLAARKRG